MPDKEILRGWKEIEAYLGLTRPIIVDCGYPVHREVRKGRVSVSVFASKKELLDFALGRPIITRQD